MVYTLILSNAWNQFWAFYKEKLMGKFVSKLIFVSLLLSALVFDSQPRAMAQEEEMAELKEIEVKSAFRREELQSTSATVLGNQDVADRIYISPVYMLRQAPGVRINEFNLQGVASHVQFRGFNGGHGGDIGFYYDGIPLNDNGHGDNYSDISILIPYEIEAVEIIKGPISALYGKGNGAGTAAFQGIKRGTFNRLMVRAGMNSTYEVQGIVAKDAEKLHHVYAFQAYTTDTWRDNTYWRKFNLSARWTYDVSDDLEISLNVRAAIAKWENALQAFNWMDAKKGTEADGHRDRYDARLFLNYFLNQNSQLSYYFFATTLENNMAEAYAKSPVAPSTQYAIGEKTGNDQTGKREAYGTGLAYNYKGEIASRDFSATVGTDYLWEKQRRDQYNLHYGYGLQHFDQITDMEYILHTISLYSEVNYQLIDKLKLRLGGRYDRIWGDIEYGPHNDKNKPKPGHYNSKKIGIFSPKAGLLFTPNDIIEIYANYGKGFNLPGLNNAQFFTKHQLKMTEREQWELGFRASPYNWLTFGSVYYLANTKNDIQHPLDAPSDVLENIGKTRRRGLETFVKLYPVEYLTISGDFSYQDVKNRVNAANPRLNGRRITNVPRYIYNAEISYAPPEGWGGRASFNWNADVMLRDDPSSTLHPFYSGEDYGTLDLQVSYKFSDRFKLSLDVTNVFDDRPKQGVPNQYGYFAYWAPTPTAAYLTLEMNL
jgi:outer membrane receptor protein involved in Fe transport